MQIHVQQTLAELDSEILKLNTLRESLAAHFGKPIVAPAEIALTPPPSRFTATSETSLDQTGKEGCQKTSRQSCEGKKLFGCRTQSARAIRFGFNDESGKLHTLVSAKSFVQMEECRAGEKSRTRPIRADSEISGSRNFHGCTIANAENCTGQNSKLHDCRNVGSNRGEVETAFHCRRHRYCQRRGPQESAEHDYEVAGQRMDRTRFNRRLRTHREIRRQNDCGTGRAGSPGNTAAGCHESTRPNESARANDLSRRHEVARTFHGGIRCGRNFVVGRCSEPGDVGFVEQRLY